MFVVKRPFKSLGKVHTAGTVITEPALIKRFKGKVAEGKIIEVTEQTYDDTAKYFKDKYGVVLPPLSAKPTTEVKTEEVKTEEVKTEEVKAEEAKTEEVKTEEVKTEVKAKTATKATAKANTVSSK